MGIVNRTPDSFFDGGRYEHERAARERIEALIAEGADIVDIGAESTRPGAPAVPAAEQIERLGDCVAWAAARGLCVSVDTTSAEVAEHAVGQGARMINSVSLEPAAELAAVAARSGAELVLTHCRGSMADMAGFSSGTDDAYGDVVDDVAREWAAAADRAVAAGLERDRIVFDPGLGFAKNARQSLELSRRLDELKARVGHRLLVGPGRKSYLARAVAGELGGEPPAPGERLGATIAAALECAARGADILRVHDVAPVRQAIAYAMAGHRRDIETRGSRRQDAPGLRAAGANGV
jgi:dihydropteroate synthase